MVFLLVLILMISCMVLNMVWCLMLNMMCFALNRTHNVYMICIRGKNPLTHMVGGFVVQPNLGWLGGGVSSVVGWLVGVGIRIVV